MKKSILLALSVCLFTDLQAQKNCQFAMERAAALYAVGDYTGTINVLQTSCRNAQKYKMLYLANYELRELVLADKYLDSLAMKYYHADPVSDNDPDHLIKAWTKHREIWSLSLYAGINGTWPLSVHSDSVRENYRPVAGFATGLEFHWNPYRDARSRLSVQLETGLGVVNQSYAYQRQLAGDVSYSGYFGRWDVQLPVHLQFPYLSKATFIMFGITNNFLFKSSVQSDFPQKTLSMNITSSRVRYMMGVDIGTGIILPFAQGNGIKRNVKFVFKLTQYTRNTVKPGSKTTYIPGYENVDEINFKLNFVFTASVAVQLVSRCR